MTSHVALTDQVLDEIIAVERRDLNDSRLAIDHLASINSGTANVDGTATVQGALVDLFASIGVTGTIEPSEPGWRVDDDGERHDVAVGPIMHASFRPTAARRLAIVGHADTVFGLDHPFQQVVRDGDRLRGPGVADMKGGLVGVVRALAAIARHELAPDLGIDVIVNADEEIGSPGSAGALDRAAQRATSGHALVVEPRLPDGTFAGSRPASANVALVVSGATAHAGRALAEGRNAVLGASRLAVTANALTGARHRLGVNVAAITGGGPLNAVPDRCVVRINLRCPSTDDLQWAIDQIDAHIETERTEHELDIVRHGGIHRPAKPWTDASSALAEVVTAGAERLDLPTGFTDTGGVCDGNNLTARGLAVVDTLGVAGAGIHTSDEFADMGQWAQNIALLTNTIASIPELRSPASPTPTPESPDRKAA